jgi:signal transduction histidine kinase
MMRLARAERTLIRVRWIGVVFAVVQVTTYYLPHPPGAMAWAAGLIALLAAGNVAAQLAARRVTTRAQANRLAVAGLALDLVVVSGFVFVYTFDVDTAIWAVLYVLPLEGAIKLQLPGALWTMAVVSVIYIVREIFGTAVYGNPFLLPSISFRMGIGFIIAWVAGAMASNLVAERNELAAAKAELERAGEIKDDFLAMTNHELRTPLTTILGYASMLDRRWDTLGDAAKRDALHQIAQQGQRLHDLVEDLLTISSAQAGALQVEVEPVGLAALVHEAVAQLLPDGGADVRCPESLLVLADRRRLGQILTNYLSNARKYGAPPIDIEAAEDGATVVVKVTDSGYGVPDAFVPRLFEKFSQASVGASRTAEGTGLGLAIVRELAEAQGGEVWYEPRSPQGSAFCLRLRRGDLPPAAPHAVRSPELAPTSAFEAGAAGADRPR